MVKVKRQIEEGVLEESDSQDHQGRDFPPLRKGNPSSEERWDLIQTEMTRHQDVLAELADS